jgi:hypothetical protein
VVLQRKRPDLLDRFGVGIARNAQHIVVVALGGSGHGSKYESALLLRLLILGVNDPFA